MKKLKQKIYPEQSRRIILKGIPASAGVVKGKVRIILDPSECTKMEEGEILVTGMTNPFFTPAILIAKAIITDFGGTLSHAAIIARELDIPCIVGSKKATEILKDRMIITVDGKKGFIYAKN